MPTVRKNEASWSDKRQEWRIDIKRDGVRKSFYSSVAGRKGKLEAERKADLWLTGGMADDMRFGALWKAYLESIDRSDSDAHYIKQEQLGRLWLLPKLQNHKVASITLQMMQDCVNAPFKEKGLSKKTCLNVRGALTAAYNCARRNRVAMERPEGLKPPKGAEVGKRVILQPNQLKVLFSHDSYPYRGGEREAFFIYCWRFLVVTGLRRGEAAGLRHNDIIDNVLYINRSINSMRQETKGKNENAQRCIYLNDIMRSILADQQEMLKRRGIISPWLFPGRDGGQVNPYDIWSNWATYKKHYGISSTIHELRHTMISAAKVEVPEDLLKAVVGHSDAMDTKGVYGHAVDGEARRASELLNKVFLDILKED